MALILSLETGTDICSVALAEGGRPIAEIEESGRDHASKLGAFADRILKESGTEPSRLDAVAVSKGPGSYTGLRIGTSLAKGMCYALDIPLIAVGSLDALAYQAAAEYAPGHWGIVDSDWPDTRLCPMIDARRMEVYTRTFTSDATPISDVEARIITPETFDGIESEILIFGSGAAKCREVLAGDNIHFAEIASSARGMTALAERAYAAGEHEDVAYFEPFYLKDFVITTRKKKFF